MVEGYKEERKPYLSTRGSRQGVLIPAKTKSTKVKKMEKFVICYGLVATTPLSGNVVSSSQALVGNTDLKRRRKGVCAKATVAGMDSCVYISL